MWSQFTRSRSSAGTNTLQGSQTTGRSFQSSSGISEIRYTNSKDFHNDGKMKLSSNLGQHREEKQDKNGSALCPVIWKTLDDLSY